MRRSNKAFCNGRYLLKSGFTNQTKCQRLTDEAINQIVNGDNVLAAYCRNTGGPALLDFGLYIENKTYTDAEPAILKQKDVQATRTQFVFQCGDVELQIDFYLVFFIRKVGYDRLACRFPFLSDSYGKKKKSIR